MVSPSLKELPSSLPPPANHSESERGRGSYFAPSTLILQCLPLRRCHIPHAGSYTRSTVGLAEPSQYVLPGAAGQLHPGCAHFPLFFWAIENPLGFFFSCRKSNTQISREPDATQIAAVSSQHESDDCRRLVRVSDSGTRRKDHRAGLQSQCSLLRHNRESGQKSRLGVRLNR